MLTWTTEEVAEILEVAPGTVRMWIHKKYLKAVKTANRDGNRIRETSLLKFIDDRPKYRQIFMNKLFNTASIGGKDSVEVRTYLEKKGYLT